MKKISLILLGILIPVSVFAYTSPGKPTGFVNDFAGILSVQEKQDIEAKLVNLQKGTGFEVSVATVKSLGGDSIEQYAVKLFEEWGIGVKGKDNGLLILVAPNEHEMKIETGYGTGAVVTDLQSGNIIRTVMIPAFKQGKYGVGISDAVDALTAIITNSPEAAQYSTDSQPKPTNGFGSDFNFNWVIFFVIIALNGLARMLGKTKSWWLGGVIGAVVGMIIGFIFGFFNVGLIAIVILTLLGLLFDYIVSKHPPGSGGRGGGFWPIFLGGGRGGSVGGGGFGGFGGGMSGGGGASGRW